VPDNPHRQTRRGARDGQATWTLRSAGGVRERAHEPRIARSRERRPGARRPRRDDQGTHAVPEDAGTCRWMRPDAGTRFPSVRRDFGSLSRGRTSMVRKGSPVRVRQRASETALQRGFLLSGSAPLTPSGCFLARRGQAWPSARAVPCPCAPRQRRVVDRRYPRGTRPAGTCRRSSVCPRRQELGSRPRSVLLGDPTRGIVCWTRSTPSSPLMRSPVGPPTSSPPDAHHLRTRRRARHLHL
jgi:hypothetical protein